MILKLFANIGYQMDVRVLEANHYGVPEKRKRTIFIGSRLKGDIVFPQITHQLKPKTVGQILTKMDATKASEITILLVN
mgnify:CR=1 FL=1